MFKFSKCLILLVTIGCILLAVNLMSTNNQPDIIYKIVPQSAKEIIFDTEYVLIKTKQFMSKGVEETDPDLILFVRSLIHPPSAHDYNFTSPKQGNIDYSQEGQSKFIDDLLKKKTNGFFIGI